MQSKSRPDSPRTFIEQARRRQIVDGAISAIASDGLPQTSLARIAQVAGTSKGVVTYHFAGRDELIKALINALLTDMNRYVKARVDRATGGPDRLRAYIEASFAFMAEHRDSVVTLVDIWGSLGNVKAKRAFNAAAYEPCRHHIAGILRDGQRAGEFREFAPATLAVTIQGAIDGVMVQWVFDRDSVDLPSCAAELVRMFDLATRPI